MHGGAGFLGSREFGADLEGGYFKQLRDDLLSRGMVVGSIDYHGGPAGDGQSLHSPQVHQATGMISVQLDLGMQDAFARLRGRAFADRRSLAEVAADVVARRLRFDRTGQER